MRKKWFIFTTVLFIVLLFWRGALFLNEDAGWYKTLLDLWGLSYQVVAFTAGIYCLIIGQKWGIKTTMGRVVFIIACGLFGQVFGQITYGYLIANGFSYYPSIGDMGYFFSMLAYIVAAYYLLFAAGFRQVDSTKRYMFVGLLSWFFLLIASYYLFLFNHDYSDVDVIVRFLDFGYPFGQSLYVVLSFVSVLLSRKYLGGLLFRPMLLFFIAFLAHYISDFTFLFLQTRDLWNGGYINDVMFLCSYYIMALSIFILDHYYYRVTK